MQKQSAVMQPQYLEKEVKLLETLQEEEKKNIFNLGE